MRQVAAGHQAEPGLRLARRTLRPSTTWAPCLEAGAPADDGMMAPWRLNRSQRPSESNVTRPLGQVKVSTILRSRASLGRVATPAAHRS